MALKDDYERLLSSVQCVVRQPDDFFKIGTNRFVVSYEIL